MIRIAYVTPRFVERPLDGWEMRLQQFQHVLGELSRDGLAIWDLSRGAACDPSGGAAPSRRARAAPPARVSAPKRLALLLARLSPAYAARSLDGQRERLLRWLDASAVTDVVVVHPHGTELVPELRRRGLRVFVDAHNVEIDVARELAAAAPSLLERLDARVRLRILERRERAFACANEVWLPSEADAARQRALSGAALPVRCVPNAVDLSRYPPAARSPSLDVVFPGHFGYRPNADAARMLHERIMPRVRETFPGARLVVVGRDPYGWAAEACRGPHAVVTGEVADAVPVLRGAAVVPVPLLSGSGTRFKILEALALRLPVVTTALGCGGLAVADGEHVLIRPPGAFADAVVALLGDFERACRLGERGRALVEARYSWDGVREPVRAALLGAHHQLSARR